MKKVLVFLLLVGISASCHKNTVEPTKGVKATVLGVIPPPFGACNYAYQLTIGNERYSTEIIPSEYATPGTVVYITYKQDEACTQRSNSKYLIKILTIHT